jgi:hypothetical protein
MPADRAEPNCSQVKGWLIDVDPWANGEGGGIATYNFLRTASGWVSSHYVNGSQPFGTLKLSLKEASFDACNLYNHSSYIATFSGLLASNCTIGESYYGLHSAVLRWLTPLGTWADTAHQHGTFLASPLVPVPPTIYSVSPDVGSSAGGTPVTITGSGLWPGSHVVVDLCPVGTSDSANGNCGEATNVFVDGDSLITAITPMATNDILSKCGPAGMCKAQLSVEGGPGIVSNDVTFAYERKVR